MYSFTLFVILITIMILTFYESIKPDFSTPNYNYVPLPITFPDEGKIIPSSSCDILSKCDPGIGCAFCGSDYECTPVGDNENVVFQGQKVSPGLWCLPKGKREMTCGTYTGRAVWTKNKGWECVCLYPDLFSGKNCNKQIACKDPNSPDLQNENKLVNIKTGITWDPSNPNFNPNDTTPYDIDENGNPLFICECNSKENELFIRLPEDPYRCHREPCSPNHKIPMWDNKLLKCDCTAGGETANQYAYSNISRKCIRTSQCAWNDVKQQCKCPENQISQTCDSKTMKRKNPSRPPCPDLPGGSFCNNPCEGYCQNDGIPKIVGTECQCTCKDRGDLKIFGKRCENTCIKDGVEKPVDRRKCCNGFYRKIPCGIGRASTCWACGPDPSGSCFIKGSKVTMANGDLKNIEEIKLCDEVLSSYGYPVKVTIIDKVNIGNRKLIGFNDLEPFITEDHCLINEKKERITFNLNLAVDQKHWENIKEIIPGDSVITQSGIQKIFKIKEKIINKTEEVYDIITEDHTLIVNGIHAFDDMVEIEKHPIISVLINKLIKCANLDRMNKYYNLSKFSEILFRNNIMNILLELENEENFIEDIFQSELKEFLYNVQHKNNMLHLGSNLWRNKFKELEIIENLILLSSNLALSLNLCLE